jgi:2-keto-4-pentenoate hydratase/2-oxohepta-3-ene-1,7-dioic acid hydratase in catechol pathway
MKLLNYETNDGARLAASVAAGIIVFADQAGMSGSPVRSLPLTLQELVLRECGVEQAKEGIAASIRFATEHSVVRPPQEVIPAKLYEPRNIFCVGRNYRAHAEESGEEIPQSPIFFAKWSGCTIGHRQPIIVPPQTHELDYEAELAVVIGKTCRNATKDNAVDYIAGYTCMNDISARDLQRADGQWTRAKSQDTFGPFGPYLVTKDEIPNPQNLSIKCLINGRMLQDSNTRYMIFSISELICFISRGITLRPGDVISTGTPSGVGFAQDPPVFLKDGDEVVVQISGLGELRNSVQDLR